MSRITIVRTGFPWPISAVAEAVSGFLFGCLCGMSDADKKMWKRLWTQIKRMDAGEIFTVEFIFQRNPKFHRKMFALFQVGFDAWEPDRKHKTHKGKPVEKNFERFRSDITILAGYYDQVFDLKGRMKLEAKSISFAKMVQDEFEQLYSAVIDVLLREVCTKYAGREELDSVVEQILNFDR